MEPDAGPGARDGDVGAARGWSEREWSVAGGGPPGEEHAALAWLETAWTGEDPFVAGGTQDETAGAWLAGTEGSEALEADEAEIWPALAAIIPAVISAAPAVIDAVKQLTRPKPSPAPPRAAPPPPRPPAPARPAPPTRPVPVAPPPRQTAVPRPAPVPRPTAPPPAASGPAPSGAGGAADTVELLRLLAGLLPQLTALLSGPTAREWIEAAELEAPWDDVDPAERLAEQLPSAPPSSDVAGRRPAGRSPISTEHTGTEHTPTEHAVAEATSAEHAPGESAERESDAAASSEGQDERGPPAVQRSPADVATVADGAAQEVVAQDGAADVPAITDLVPLPDRSTINVGVSPCPTSLLVSRFGRPRDLVTAECQAITSPFWEGRMTTGRVGTFRVRGHHRAVALLAEAFAALEATDPDLHGRVGSSGMLCVRHVRGRPGVLSNHALGLALDVTIDGRTDIRGDDQVQRGLLRLHEVLAPFGVFWGAGVRPEDAIHFEIGAELVHRWLEEGIF